jgi:hypothetical protein
MRWKNAMLVKAATFHIAFLSFVFSSRTVSAKLSKEKSVGIRKVARDSVFHE